MLIDYVATPESGELRPGSDARDARWVPVGDLGRYETTEGLASMVEKAANLKSFFEWK